MRRVALACILLVGACDAFPDSLRSAISGSNAVADAGGVRNADGGVTDQEATLVFADVGTHLTLGVLGDWIVWSSNVDAGSGYRVRYCLSNDCAAPGEFIRDWCGTGTNTDATGYFAIAGAKVVLTNPGCQGWVCAFEPGSPPGSETCGFGDDVYRLAGDAANMIATNGGVPGAPENRLEAFTPAFAESRFQSEGTLAVPKLVTTGSSGLAVSTARVHWTESAGDGHFRVAACSRALAGCGTPAEVVKPRAGWAVALAATDTDVFVAFGAGVTSQLLRVAVPSGEETVVAASSVTIGSVTITGSGDFVYWSEGNTIRRCSPASGACAAETVGHLPSAITHLAVTSDGATVYALAGAGVYRLQLAPT